MGNATARARGRAARGAAARRDLCRRSAARLPPLHRRAVQELVRAQAAGAAALAAGAGACASDVLPLYNELP
jgi:hypothetical protein